MEVWKRTCEKISSFEYYVSDKGRVARRIKCAAQGTDTTLEPYLQIGGLCKLLKPYKGSESNKNSREWRKRIGKEPVHYLCVSIMGCPGAKKTRKTKRVHQLVCLAFHVKPESKEVLVPNHKNWNTQDNRAENLEWVTDQQNRAYRQPMTDEQLKKRDQAHARDFLDGKSKTTNIQQRSKKGKKLNSWRARIQYRDKRVGLGHYKSPAECTKILRHAYEDIFHDRFVVPKLVRRNQYV